MNLPGCVMDDWWDHNGLTSYCGLFNQQVNYLKVCVGGWYGWLNHQGVITYWGLFDLGARCLQWCVMDGGRDTRG